MTNEERERMYWLCQELQVENDPKRFSQLAQELVDLLERKSLSSFENNIPRAS